MKKILLDTNVILDGPFESIVEAYEKGTEIMIPHIVLEELDTFKKGNETKNEYARSTTRLLDSLRKEGKLSEGVDYLGRKIVVTINDADLNLDKPDFRIIHTAKEEGAKLITQDINARVVADSLGVEAENFAPNHIDVNELYTGYKEIEITEDESVLLGSEVSNSIVYLDDDIYHNQFVIMKGPMGEEYEGIYKEDKGKIVLLDKQYTAFNVKPRKKKGSNESVREQRFLMHLLLDPDIQFVTAIGPSGCGKTLLTIAAALQQSEKEDVYNKVTVMRPLISIGNDIGFLPGDKLEKLEPWMGSTFDALDFLMENEESKAAWSARDKTLELIHSGRVELEAMAHIRGRSLPNQFLIVDDAQNLTQQEAASIITRAAEGTKVVFLGDLSEKQIDNHRLTPSSNGLAYVIDKFKGEEIVGHITLNTVVRSKLAQLGVEKL